MPTELLGDKVERVLHLTGADRLARILSKTTGKPCRCKQRKKYLNELHKRVQEMRNQVLIDQMKNRPKR